MSAAGAPSARADDFTDVINLTASESAITTAEGFMSESATFFGAGDYGDGLYASALGSDCLQLPLDYFIIAGAEAVGL